MQYVKMRDGNKLYVRVVGEGNPCILLHGFGMHSGHWTPMILPFQRGTQFIVPDLRGFGKSHHVDFNKPDVLTNYAEDLEDLIAHFGFKEVKLGGVSMGAYAALQYHRMNGFKNVSKYLHIDQSPQCRNDEKWNHGLAGNSQARVKKQFEDLLEVIKPYDRRLAFEELPEEVQKQFRSTYGDFAAYTWPRLYQKIITRRVFQMESLSSRLLPLHNWSVYLDIINAYLHQDYDMRPSLKGIKIHVTVMVGMKSDMYPYQGQFYIFHQVRKAKLVQFRSSGHAPMITEPLKFLFHFRQFLK